MDNHLAIEQAVREAVEYAIKTLGAGSLLATSMFPSSSKVADKKAA